MKPVRLVFIGVATLVVLSLVAAAIAFNSSFQTWVTRRALAKYPELRASIGSVDVGWRRIELKNVRLEPSSASVSVPLIEAELSVFRAAFGRGIDLRQLAARGWTIDLTKTSGSSTGKESVPVDPATAAMHAFAGLFAMLELPVDLAVERVELEGDVILPDTRGRAKINVTGGGLGANREGKFDLAGEATLADAKINVLKVRGVLTAAMATPRSFTRMSAKVDGSARGAQIPQGVTLSSDIAADRTAVGETYSIAVRAPDRSLFNLQATTLKNARELDGVWQIDMRDTDLSPFALGGSLPKFSALGEGNFKIDAGFTAIRGKGRLAATASDLSSIKSELAAIGSLHLAAEFDLAQRGGTLTVDQLQATLTSEARPVAAMRSLQSFSFDFTSRKLAALDPAREVFGLDLRGVPLAWAQPFFPTVRLAGGDVRGELVATARGGGIHVRSKSALAISATSIAYEERPWLNDISASLHVAADYAPQGWQAELSALNAKSAEATLFTLEAKAGQLTGADQPIKATGKLIAHLAAWSAQPFARNAAGLTGGEGSVDFAASLGTTREMQATITLSNLSADPKVVSGKLPSLSTALRADISSAGQITLNAPIQIERDGRKSDLTIAGTLTPAKNTLTLDAQVTSTNFVVDDAQVLAALIPSKAKPGNETDNGLRDAAPLWSGLNGTLALALKRVTYSGNFQASDVIGTLRIADGTLRLDGLRMGLGETGSAKLDGAVTFDANVKQPYGLTAEMRLNDFDPGPLFHALNPSQPPTVEGYFQIASKFTARGATLVELPLHAAGDFQLTSRGGIFRGLPVNVASIAENTGTIAALIASAGNALSEFTGRKDNHDFVSKAQAVSELAKRLSVISYDQLNLSITRDAALNTAINDFTLISPEVRLSGNGRITHQSGARLLDDRLALEFKLRARDQVANLLKRIGRIEAETDELGYATCTLPLKVSGTLGRPQTGELNRALVAIALEKTDFMERLLGK